jgi:hypothetical protein
MQQVSKTSKIILNGSITEVFPLFSAIGEKKWVQGWYPEFIYPGNGDFVENAVFKTKSNNTFEKEFNWITSYLNEKDCLVVYTVFTKNRVWTIKVNCTTVEEKTQAEITYTYIGLNEKGNKLNGDAIEKMFRNNLSDWEAAINYFLKTGEMAE